ncbi:E3 ubiquitin-protein ligase RNF10 isoform X2 [Bacillus rossius redtenbacheri]|uniref:E3 ubiquitin-protein ligase RNF10 isoform X1 n=1 Tax=Bacillus rossius redtenbacheri TaxID=93214 RepID=UPI002FDD8984
MLEEFAMEKKSTNRSGQPPVKGVSTESKKLQDGVGSKQFPRSYRKREPNGANGQKCDPSRKPVPQKNKSFDKRPRQRTQCFDGGKENSKVAVEDVAEYGSVLVPGSKKQNLNHLLNFHYAPREGVGPGSGQWRHGVPGYCRQTHGRWLATYKHKYNKEQFLQANCQFVVKADGNYTSYSSNPDALVEWDLIEQIRIQSSDLLSCPICLYPPVAAKMTRCGHVYCWPCILHYLALSDKTWRKCPICYEAVHKEDLKSVLAIPHAHFPVGSEITLRLMKREKGSLIATPAAEFDTHPGRLLSVSETALDTVYSKLLLATSAEVLPIIDCERKELEIQLAEEKDSPEMCFIEQALELLKHRQADVTSKTDQTLGNMTQNVIPAPVPDVLAPLQPARTVAQKIPAVVYSSAFDDCVLEGALGEEESGGDEGQGVGDHRRYESVSSESCSDDGNIAAACDGPQPGGDPAEEAPPVKCFYFYQAADGQHIYLHALNVRMLESSHGSLKDCPPVLRGRIAEKESGSMTEELRGRLRYLQHLPVTCQFDVVEIVLRPPLVSRAALDKFRDQLEMRKRKRQHRAREERRREKHITEEENRRWGRGPAPKIRLESHHQFPLCGSETPPVPATPTGPPSTASSDEVLARNLDADLLLDVAQAVDDAAASPPVQPEEEPPAVGSPDSGFSFAQMLREGRGKGSGSWAVPRRTANRQAGPQHSDSDPEQGEHAPSPSYKLNFSDAIALALEKAAPSGQVEQGECSVSAGKKKKKQKKPKVLFATGMACPGGQ